MAVGERKRKRSEQHSRPTNGTNSGSGKGEGFYFEHEWAQMQVAARELTKQVPSLESHIELFVDAEDPDAGIEVSWPPGCWFDL